MNQIETKNSPDDWKPTIIQCPSDVLDGLIHQLNSKKAWKRYLRKALCAHFILDVYYKDHIPGVGRVLEVFLADFGDQEYCLDEIKYTMKLWEKAFNGRASLVYGPLSVVEF